MSKLGKTTTKATFSLLNIVTKPIYNQMRRERKEELRRWEEKYDRWSQDAQANLDNPRVYEVHQPFDAIIHQHRLW
jgi:hypothetical protein